jgi:predicted RecB family nuclease
LLNANAIDADSAINFESTTDNEIVYMIGLLEVSADSNEKKYHQFIAETLDKAGEQAIMTQMLDVLKQHQEDLVIYHWGHIEKTMYHKKIESRLAPKNITFNNMIEDVFKTHGIVIKNAYSFGLKSIVSAMIQNKQLSEEFAYGSLSDGLNTTITTMYYYGNKDRYTNEFDGIVTYNKNDVFVLYEIMKYLRSIS